MAKKEISGYVKLQIKGGQANPAPPVGPALGQAGLNIMDFCKAFNADTQDKMGDIIPVEITVYADRSFTFITKTPPASRLILKSAKSSTMMDSYDVASRTSQVLFTVHTDLAALHTPWVYRNLIMLGK